MYGIGQSGLAAEQCMKGCMGSASDMCTLQTLDNKWKLLPMFDPYLGVYRQINYYLHLHLSTGNQAVAKSYTFVVRLSNVSYVDICQLRLAHPAFISCHQF